MSKQKLLLEDLDVTSFSTLPESAELKGTVEAHQLSISTQPSCASSCPNWTCEGATCAKVIC